MAIAGNGVTLVAVIWFEMILSILFIGLRLYTRGFVKGKLGWDDWSLILLWIIMIAFAGETTVAATYGMGQRVADLSTEDYKVAMFHILTGQCIVSLGIGMGKVVVALFLMRIVTNMWHRAILWFCIVSMMVFSVLLSIAVWVQVTPVQALWDPALADQRKVHLSLTVIAKVDCAWAAAMDFFLAFLPWVILWNLNMKRKEKYTICASLSLGIFAGICGIIRTSGLDALSQTDDYLFAITDSVIWTSSEVTTTIVCVCIPAMRPLYTKLTGGSSSGGYQDYTHEHSHGFSGKSPLSKNSYGMKNLDSNADKGPLSKDEYEIKTTATTGTGRDSDSDRSILGFHGVGGAKEITKTQEISVTYEDNVGRFPPKPVSIAHAV